MEDHAHNYTAVKMTDHYLPNGLKFEWFGYVGMLLSCKLLESEFIPEEACFHRPPVAAGAVSQSIISRIIICTAQAHGFGMFSCEAFLCRVVLDV